MPPSLNLASAGQTPLANQVAGHQNVLSDASGSLVIKPALPREIAFYHLLTGSSPSSALHALKPFTPAFYGTLQLSGRVEAGEVKLGGVEADMPESVVLENLAHRYVHPSILDVKLGTVLHEPDATPEKRARMEKQAKETTTAETGVRLTGSQTWHPLTQSFILTPKSYGKAITASQLPEGIARFFPLPTDSIPALVLPLSPPPSSSASSPTASTSAQSASALPLLPTSSQGGEAGSAPNAAIATPTAASAGGAKMMYTNHPLSPNLMLRVLDVLLGEIDGLIAVLDRLEARFVGSSVLVVYESDPAQLEADIQWWEEKRIQRAAKSFASGPSPGEGDDADEAEDESESDSGSESSDDEDGEEVGDEGQRRKRRKGCAPVTLRMIDFAHTSLCEGQGRDEGVMKGLRCLRGLVEGRRAEVKLALDGQKP